MDSHEIKEIKQDLKIISETSSSKNSLPKDKLNLIIVDTDLDQIKSIEQYGNLTSYFYILLFKVKRREF